MKLIPALLLFTLTTWPCRSARTESSPKIYSDGDDDRQLRRKRRNGPTKTHKIKPIGTPKNVRDAKGRIKRRKSIVDLSDLVLGDDDESLNIQLMSDEAPQTLTMTRGSRQAGSYESWHGMDAATGHHLTMVKTKTPWGDTVTTGTMTGKNGTVYQIRTLAGGNVVSEEVKQGMFDKEVDAVRSDAKRRGDVGGSHGRRSLRRLDSASEIDIMVSPETNKS